MAKRAKAVKMEGNKKEGVRYLVEYLKGGIIHIEEIGKKGSLTDDTFFVPNKSKLEREARVEVIGKRKFLLQLEDGKYLLTIDDGKEKMITLEGPRSFFFQMPILLKNTGHLPEPALTPSVYMLTDYPRVIMPKEAYGTVPTRKGGWKVRRDGFELYLLLCMRDPYLLRKQYASLTGTAPLVPLSALGAWDSRYFEYTDASVKEEVENYEKYDLPLDYFVIDTDWRKSGAKPGAGYTLNKEDFPDLSSTFAYLHEKGISSMFNDHPEPLKEAKSLWDYVESSYRKENLTHYLELGLDAWWYDRNWWTRLKTPVKEIHPETFGLYLYQNVEEDFHQKTKKEDYPLRSLVMGNVDNVLNGEWIGIDNSASHRYGIQWTGDNWMTNFDLKQEFANMLRGGNDLITYINSDLTGHIGDGSERLYARWLEFGAFSPIYRFHSTKGNKRYRQAWNYGEVGLKVAREYGHLRYRLLPLYYSLAHEAYETGVPMIRSLTYLDKSKKARREDVALLGDHLLFGLVPHEDISYAPEEDAYIDGVKFTYFEGKECKGEPIYEEKKKVLHEDWSYHSPIPNHSLYHYSAIIEFTFVSTLKGKNTLLIGSDDGIRVYVDGELKDDFWGNRGFAYDEIMTLEEGEKHHIKIEYFQDEGGAGISLLMRPLEEKDDIASTYLPKGKMYRDLFTGELRKGGREFKKAYSFLQIPLYTESWNIIPLLPDHNNAKKKAWDTLILDLYASDEAGSASVDLYEDDQETLAYQNGQFRLTRYTFSYCNEKEYELTFGVPQGSFTGEKWCEKRHMVFRLHLNDGKKLVHCYDPGDGQVLPITFFKRDPSAFPLKSDGASPDADVYQMEADVPLKDVGEMHLRFVLD